MLNDIVKRFFQDTVNNGYKFAREITDGGSFIVKPAIIDNPPEHSMVVAEEAFCPIVPVMSWTTEDEVISRLNNTTTDLGGAVWSSDTDYAYALAKGIEADTLWINSFEKTNSTRVLRWS